MCMHEGIHLSIYAYIYILKNFYKDTQKTINSVAFMKEN